MAEIPLSASLGRYEKAARATRRLLDRQNFSARLWAKDGSLWKSNPAVKKKIENRLGWLTVTKTMSGRIDELTAFARSIRKSGFSHAVLLGMGGSSLCPEVLQRTYGVKPGFPRLRVLDSTDPASIRRIEKVLDLKKTLFIVASKSGMTLEVQALYRYFHKKVRTGNPGSPGDQFIAITDAGTPLETLARKDRFRKTFLNSADIGGRYSALSYFGLVPAVLIGMDPAAILDRAGRMVQRCGPDISPEENPGIRLGTVLGALAKAGRDKMTLIVSAPIRSFGVWIEQLVAESTGKEGKGIVPIEGEAIGRPEFYGKDRLFVFMGRSGSTDRKLNQALRAFEQSGHPVVRILLRDSLDLVGEFFRWEVATAVAGMSLKVNPFDEPNVSESKENTRKILDEFEKTGRLSDEGPNLAENGILLYGAPRKTSNGSLKDAFWNFIDRAGPGDYVALSAYLESSGAHEIPLQSIRLAIRDRLRIATTLGYGPRFLHSTGQLHKGGPKNGRFIQITADHKSDCTIPGERYTFGTLIRAQAMGDFHSLLNRDRPILRIHLGSDVETGLKRLIRLLGITPKR